MVAKYRMMKFSLKFNKERSEDTNKNYIRMMERDPAVQWNLQWKYN